MGMTDAQWKDNLRFQLQSWETVLERVEKLAIDDEELLNLINREIKRIKEGLES